MRTASRVFIGLLILCCGLGVAPKSTGAPNIIFFNGDTYAAIAYSEKMGNYGYWYNAGDRFIAEVMAKKKCNAQDAKVVVWVHNGFCALAIGEDGGYGWGYSYGDGASNTEAKKNAIDECLKRSKKVKTLVCVCSLDRKPEIHE